MPPKLNPQIREWRTDRTIVRSLPGAKATGQTSAACIFVWVPRNLTRSSITHRRERGNAAIPPGTAGRRRCDVGPLGVSGGA